MAKRKSTSDKIRLTASRQSQTNVNATDTSPYRQPIDPGKAEGKGPILDQELLISQESAIASRYELLQYNPDELFTRKGVRLLEKMATTDDQIQFGLSTLKMMILSPGYEIRAASESSEDEAIADEVAANFVALEGGHRNKMFSILGSLDLGTSFHEKKWTRWEKGTKYEGRVRLQTLKSKKPQWFNPIMDDFGNVIGFVMISPPAYGRKIPVRKVLINSEQKRYENVWGTARTRALYDWWYLKGLSKAALAVLSKKYGKETPIGFVPDNMSPNDKQTFLVALRDIAEKAAVTVPAATKVEWAKFDPSSITGLLAIIEKADQQIIKVILGQVSSSGTSSKQAHGSNGGGSGASGGNQSGGSSKGGIQERTLDMLLDFMASGIAEGPMAELIKEIVDFNYQGVTEYPKFVFKPADEEYRTNAVSVFIKAATATVGGTPDVKLANGGTKPGKPGKGLVTPDDDDEEWIREVLGAPSAQSKETLRPAKKVNRARSVVAPTPEPIIPWELPIAGYRPPTPSAPGLPANFGENDPMPTPHRALTKYEQSVNFAESWRIMDTEGEDEIAQQAASVLRKAIDRLKLEAKSAMGDSRKIKRLEMPYRTQLTKVLSEGLQDVAKKAMRQAKAEIKGKGAAKHAEVHNLDGLAPDDVLQLIQDKSFTMAGKISDEVLNDVKQILYNGVKNGDSYSDIVYKIEDKLGKYIDLTQTEGDLAEYRLMNVVRTNVTAAYNDGRRAVFEAPGLNGFVVGYQFSAVLDGDTTPWCAAMDGKIFKVTWPGWATWTPPTWYQCRSVLVPITKVDGWDGVEDDEPKAQPPEGFN